MTNETVELKINEHEETLSKHDAQIRRLEKSEIRQNDSINSLCKRLDKLISLNNKLFYGLIAGMASLIVKLYFFH